jgi:hypothetical protein
MNVNLKSYEDLKNWNSKEADHDYKTIEERDILDYSDDIEFKNKNIILKQSNKQSNLISFVYDKRHQDNIKKFDKNKEPSILLGNTLPMKYGLRNRLINQGILFQVVNSASHIIIAKKVLIQLYNSTIISQDLYKLLIDFNKEMKDKYQLVILIIDLFSYMENFEGEKRALKKKIQSFGNNHQIQLISIENPEELFFIINSIYENQKNKIGENFHG